MPPNRAEELQELMRDAELADVGRAAEPRPLHDRRSVRGLAKYLGVSDRTVRHWLAGEWTPPAAQVAALAAWASDKG